jgi:3'(2'), 5'-bisphosphate nucleotidase
MNSPPDTNSETSLASLLPEITGLARQAGDAIMAIYGSGDFQVSYKQDASPLTQADTASHDAILAGLARLTPAWPVLSEESAETPFEERHMWQRFWMVDPLDGTKEFLKRNGEFTVNIALIEKNVPILGVVYAPAIDTMYFAAKGVGAFKAEKGITSPIAATAGEASPMRIVVSRSHHDGLDNLAPNQVDCLLIPMGSSLKFCLVAEGAAHLYPRTGPTMEWDTAAAHCILEVAGGSLSATDGKPLTYNKASLLNPGFIAQASS